METISFSYRIYNLLFSICLFGGILSIQTSIHAQTQEPERVPNLDPHQESPRWLRQIHVDGLWEIGQFTTDSNKIVMACDPDGGVDSIGITHISFTGLTQRERDLNLPPRIYYTNNQYLERRVNGFSWAIPISTSGVSGTESAISINPVTNEVNITWTERKHIIRHTTVKYSAATGVSIAAPKNVGMNGHHQSHNTVNKSGVVQIVAACFTCTPNVIDYVQGASNGGFEPKEAIPGSEGGAKPRTHHDLPGNPHVAWVDESQARAKYNRRSNGNWGVVAEVISNILPVVDIVANVDLFVACDNKIHFTWDSRAQEHRDSFQTIKYRRTESVSPTLPLVLTNVEIVSTFLAGLGGFMPRIVVDSRKQPHINWISPGGISYASKVNRPTPAQQVWGRQERISTITREPFLSLEMAITHNDYVEVVFDVGDLWGVISPEVPGCGVLPPYSPGVIAGNGEPGDPHFFHPGHEPPHVPDTLEIFNPDKRGAVFYSRMIEFNLGDQNEALMFDFGPGTSVNAATGNLNFFLRLFYADAGGLPTDFYLRYNSLPWQPGVISHGWQHSYQITATDHEDGGVISLQLDDGQTYVYKPENSAVTAEPEFGEYSVFDGFILMTTKKGEKYHFDQKTGKIVKLEDANNNAIDFGYSPNSRGEKGLLISIDDSANRPVTQLNYSDGRLKEIIDPMGRKHTLKYTGILLSEIVMVNDTFNWKFKYNYVHDTSGGKRIRMISKIFTPKGAQEDYCFDIAYRQDNRAIGCEEPEARSVLLDTLAGSMSEPVRVVRRMKYHDPMPPFDPPNVGLVPYLLGKVPAGEYINGRERSSFVEYQYKRCLPDKFIDAFTPPAVTHWYYDGYNFDKPSDSQPKYRNLEYAVDSRGAVTKYTYHDKPVVKDEVHKIFRPKSDKFTYDPTDTDQFLPPITREITDDGYHNTKELTDSKSNTTKCEYQGPNLMLIKHPGATLGDGTMEMLTEAFEYSAANGYELSKYKGPNNQETVVAAFSPDTKLPRQIIEAGAGQAYEIGRDVMGNTRSIKTPGEGGGLTSLALDALDRVTDIILPATEAGTYQITRKYDRNSNLVLQYDNVFNIDTPISKTIFDRLDRPVMDINAMGDTVAVEYTRQSNPYSIRDYLGAETFFLPDARDMVGALVGDGSTPGSATLTHRLHRKFDGNGNLVGVTLKGGGQTPDQVTEIRVNAHNIPTLIMHPENNIVDSMVFDEHDNLVAHIRGRMAGAKGLDSGVLEITNHTEYEVDEIYRTKTAHRKPVPGGLLSGALTTHFIPKLQDNLFTVRDPLGHESSVRVNGRFEMTQALKHSGAAVGEITRTDSGLPKAWKYPHPDGSGSVTAAINNFNSWGQVVKTTDYNGNAVEVKRDLRGRPIEIKDQLGYVTKAVWDPLDRLAMMIGAAGTPDESRVMIRYDKNSEIIETTAYNPETNGYDVESAIKRDNLGRPVEQTVRAVDDQSGENLIRRWRYDSIGNQVYYKDLNGLETLRHYDLLNRCTLIVFSHPTKPAHNKRLFLKYDDADQVAYLAQIDGNAGTGAVEFEAFYTYDEANRVKTTKWVLDGSATPYQQHSLDYDNASNLVKVTDQDGRVYQYKYTDDDWLKAIGGPFDMNVTFDHTETGQVKDVYSGVPAFGATSGAVLHTHNTFDPLLRQVRSTATTAAGKVVGDLVSTFTQRHEPDTIGYLNLGVTANFDYDCLGRIVGEYWTIRDSACTDVLSSIPPGSQLTPADFFPAAPGGGLETGMRTYSVQHRYNPAGDRIGETITQGSNFKPGNAEGLAESNKNDETIYVYDAQHRLKVCIEPDGSSVIFQYDAEGNEIIRSKGNLIRTSEHDFTYQLLKLKETEGNEKKIVIENKNAPLSILIARKDSIKGKHTFYKSFNRKPYTLHLQDNDGNTIQEGYNYLNDLFSNKKWGRTTLDNSGTNTGKDWSFFDNKAIHTKVDHAGTLVFTNLTNSTGDKLPDVFIKVHNETKEDFAGLVGARRDGDTGLEEISGRQFDPSIGQPTNSFTGPFWESINTPIASNYQGYPENQSLRWNDYPQWHEFKDVHSFMAAGMERWRYPPLYNHREYLNKRGFLKSEEPLFYGPVATTGGTKNKPSAIEIGVNASIGALEGFFKGWWDFFYYGTQNLIYQTTGIEAYREGSEHAMKMAEGFIYTIKHPVEVFENASKAAARDLEHGSFKGTRDFGQTLMGAYLLGKGSVGIVRGGYAGINTGIRSVFRTINRPTSKTVGNNIRVYDGNQFVTVRQYMESWGELAAIERASILQSALSAGQKGRVTMASGYYFDASGNVKIAIASSEIGGYLRPNVAAAKYPWEVVIKGIGHAEAKLSSVILPRAIAAGRPVCPSCVRLVQDVGSKVLGPLKRK